MNFLNSVNKYIDFSFNKINIIPIFVLIVNVLALRIFNITVIYENSCLENLQLVVLAVALFFVLKVRKHKPFFNFVAMFIILMIAREISYGRVFYGAIEGKPNEFYQLSDYKYGFLVNYVVFAYIVAMFLYGFLNKIYLDALRILTKVKMPFWSVIGCAICTICQILGEKTLENTVLEETAELILYTLIAVMIYYYCKKLKRPTRLRQTHQ